MNQLTDTLKPFHVPIQLLFLFHSAQACWMSSLYLRPRKGFPFFLFLFLERRQAVCGPCGELYRRKFSKCMKLSGIEKFPRSRFAGIIGHYAFNKKAVKRKNAYVMLG